MTLNHKKFFTSVITALFLSGGMMSIAHAEDDDDYYRAKPAGNKTWQTECGSCHVAFPPRLLPAESWRAVMNGLDKHFGSDASLDEASTREITTYLEKNAGKRRNDVAGKPLLRITETHWFKREHDEVSQNTWKNPKVKSPSNCAACHTGAEKGNYSEHGIHIPR